MKELLSEASRLLIGSYYLRFVFDIVIEIIQYLR